MPGVSPARASWLAVIAALGVSAGAASIADSRRHAGAAVGVPATVKLTVEVNGDLLVHGPVWQRARAYGHGSFDFAPMLRRIAPYVKSADLAICHVETPMTPRPPQGYPIFNTPTQLARAIKQTGWRVCDT